MRDINIKAIEYFETVARQGCIGAAAVELSVTPSAVSQQLRLLEAQFGVRPFRRERPKLILTHNGDIFSKRNPRQLQSVRPQRHGSSGMPKSGSLKSCSSAVRKVSRSDISVPFANAADSQRLSWGADRLVPLIR